MLIAPLEFLIKILWEFNCFSEVKRQAGGVNHLNNCGKLIYIIIIIVIIIFFVITNIIINIIVTNVITIND